MMQDDPRFNHSELGKAVDYGAYYNPDKLFSIPRTLKRLEIGISDPLPFFGFDLWNHYEVSWLNEKGKPNVAVAKIAYSCDSPFIIESKSMKLYFNSFNHTVFKDVAVLTKTIQADLTARVGCAVKVDITSLDLFQSEIILSAWQGICLDHLDIDCSVYTVAPHLLQTETAMVEEVLYSNLLKSNCLVTHQPDWASVQITYAGQKINHAALLRYLVSFRNHPEFHEQCIERIFMDIMRHCQPQTLTVYGRYTRRGGLDINPYRSTERVSYQEIQNQRLGRQ